mmetsp:Transcript_44944/g.96898  ORF Transcript_44944/g.96898 Transcript_44944/m.96898 type:complete len:82 (+) Transcript_44944:137-382(+)
MFRGVGNVRAEKAALLALRLGTAVLAGLQGRQRQTLVLKLKAIAAHMSKCEAFQTASLGDERVCAVHLRCCVGNHVVEGVD